MKEREEVLITFRIVDNQIKIMNNELSHENIEDNNDDRLPREVVEVKDIDLQAE